MPALIGIVIAEAYATRPAAGRPRLRSLDRARVLSRSPGVCRFDLPVNYNGPATCRGWGNVPILEGSPADLIMWGKATPEDLE